jgi:hypothetical protein
LKRLGDQPDNMTTPSVSALAWNYNNGGGTPVSETLIAPYFLMPASRCIDKETPAVFEVPVSVSYPKATLAAYGGSAFQPAVNQYVTMELVTRSYTARIEVDIS